MSTLVAYRYRYGRPGTKAAELREAVHERLLEHERSGELPTSNRFILYELRQEQCGALYGHKSRKNGRGEDQNLSDASKWLRDEGLVSWDWIEDERRSLTEYRYAGSVAEYIAESVEHARIDLWAGSPPPLLICESETFGGVLRRSVAGEYLCPVTATCGQVGGFLRTNVVPLLRGDERPVFYIGDLDFRGHQIEANTRNVLEDEVGALDWRRIALTEAQVKEYRLQSVAKWDGVKRQSYPAVEVEALGQGTVTAIIRAVLDGLLPEPLEDVRARERQQRDQVSPA